MVIHLFLWSPWTVIYWVKHSGWSHLMTCRQNKTSFRWISSAKMRSFYSPAKFRLDRGNFRWWCYLENNKNLHQIVGIRGAEFSFEVKLFLVTCHWWVGKGKKAGKWRDEEKVAAGLIKTIRSGFLFGHSTLNSGTEWSSSWNKS